MLGLQLIRVNKWLYMVNECGANCCINYKLVYHRVRCGYNAVNTLPNPHPTARPLGQDIECGVFQVWFISAAVIAVPYM